MALIKQQASNRALIKQFSNLTPAKVLRGDFPSLVSLKQEHSENDIENALAVLILDASMSFGENFNQDLAYDLAAEILTSYYYLTLEDCFIVFNKLKRTKVFKFTINVVLTAFENYDNDRLKMIDDNNYSQHLSIKENRTNPTKTDDILRIIKQGKRK